MHTIGLLHVILDYVKASMDISCVAVRGILIFDLFLKFSSKTI